MNANGGATIFAVPVKELADGPTGKTRLGVVQDLAQQVVFTPRFGPKKPLGQARQSFQKLRGHQPVAAGGTGKLQGPRQLNGDLAKLEISTTWARRTLLCYFQRDQATEGNANQPTGLPNGNGHC